MSASGQLYIVATPIGHRDDMTLRAINVLSLVEVIAAEDPRHSQHLLQYHGIRTPLMSLHEHNELSVSSVVLRHLAQGQQVALITDAGTPLISDPGYRLVSAAQDAGYRVTPIPGPCAAIAALSVGGLPTNHFVFEGFLPAKRGARQHRLSDFINEQRTVIFYESPHRILDCLVDMVAVFGKERQAVIARELTKQFETVRRDSLTSLLSWIRSDPNQQKGEFVILLAGQEQAELQDEEAEAQRILKVLLAEVSLKQSVRIASQLSSLSHRSLYQLALAMQAPKNLPEI